MSGVVRRAGRVTLRDGTEIVWSVADGRRGRRWRAMTMRDGRLAEWPLELDFATLTNAVVDKVWTTPSQTHHFGESR